MIEESAAATVPDRAQRDARILELARDLQRAGVLLGLGRLSREGYARIAERMRKEMAGLEAQRARDEAKDRSR